MLKKFLKKIAPYSVVAALALGGVAPALAGTTWAGDYSCLLPVDGVRHNCGAQSQSAAKDITFQATSGTSVHYRAWVNRYNGSYWTIYGPWYFSGGYIQGVSFGTAQLSQVSIAVDSGLPGTISFYGTFSR